MHKEVTYCLHKTFPFAGSSHLDLLDYGQRVVTAKFFSNRKSI